MNEPIANNRVCKKTHTISWNVLEINWLDAPVPWGGRRGEWGQGGVFDGGAIGFFVYL